jgi:spoIIIJ-associated protein
MAEREYEGRTEEEAIDKAIEALGLTEDEIDVEVVEAQRPGFLKGGKVRIRVHLADDDDALPELEPETELERQSIEFVTALLEKANLPADVRIDHREPGRLTLEILTDDPAIVIGKHGSTLESLQLITNIHVGRINPEDEPVRVVLDTEDYRYRREQSLVRMANRVAHEVRRTGRPRLLAPLNPFERRLIHAALGELAGVTTESEGDGLYKQIRVSYHGER